MWGLAQYWEVLGTGEYPYSSEPIVGSRYYSMNGATYVPYYDELGLRERLDVMANSSGAWAVSRSEFYTDDVLGQLTSVDYNDGLANEFQSWTYDPAGNRSNSGYSFDSLNRMSASPGYVYQNDILGNRTWRNFGLPGVQRYVWDEVNRAQSICGETVGARYEYRADGLRVKKVADLTITWNPGDENQGSGFYDENLSVNKPTTRYYYDGQMCVEEDYTVWVGPFQGQSTVVTRYGVGARGIDWMERSGSGGGVSFPLYDGHGNMIATLSRSGSGSYAVSNARSYDVWGSVRSGSSSGYPNTRYCANLGHKQDDESGLLYMRARYYEPWTGRFVTEDPARDGWNWFVYANSDPNNLGDFSGRAPGWLVALLAALVNFAGFVVGQWFGYALGVLYWQQWDRTFEGTDSATMLGKLLDRFGISASLATLLAIFGPKTYAYGAGLAAKLGIVGGLGFIVGMYTGFLIATVEFGTYEESQW
ncbi:MAG: RHS repeat-associated core domain-containing protein [Armatimonadetes bacterium]|nr:RHS repeat-associated core domain-containing protein [Armatimonadota bacterium]